MKDLIISLAVNGREDYTARLEGLVSSLTEWTGDVRIYKEFPKWCRPHTQIPYAFKYDLIKKAIDDGYQRIFWVDSIMRLVPGKNISELLDEAPLGIVAFHNLGHPLYPKYISDKAAQNLKDFYIDITSIESTWGGALGFDFNKELPNLILKELFNQIDIGSFDELGSIREGFVGHRHDQSVLSVLFHYTQVPLLEYGVIAAGKDVTEKTFIKYGD